jgi:zinc and cadmium transporter
MFMTIPYIYALISVFIVSAISLIGLFTLSMRQDLVKRYVLILVSLAVGALLGDAFIHLIPEALEESSNALLVSMLIITGILLFFVLEKLFHWHHHHGGEKAEAEEFKAVGRLVLISDSVHNMLDGIIIGVSYLVSVEVGMATTIAVIFHEIPQEIGDFGILLHSGYSVTRALWLNFLSAMLAVAGVVIVFLLGAIAEPVTAWLVPIAAGGFIYIAVADLIPELHKTRNAGQSLLQTTAVLLGIAAMLLLAVLE